MRQRKPLTRCSNLCNVGAQIVVKTIARMVYLFDFNPKLTPNSNFHIRFSDYSVLFDDTNHALQLVENTLIASLITQRSVVQIHPPQPFSPLANPR